jgi:hypothetical protein
MAGSIVKVSAESQRPPANGHKADVEFAVPVFDPGRENVNRP